MNDSRRDGERTTDPARSYAFTAEHEQAREDAHGSLCKPCPRCELVGGFEGIACIHCGYGMSEDERDRPHPLRAVSGHSNPRSVTIYQADAYVAVCIVREGGTPEWHVSQVNGATLENCPPSEAEDVARALGLT